MNLKTLSHTLIVLALAGCASSGGTSVKPVPPSAASLDDAQIRSTLVGNKLTNIKKPASMSFNADGTEFFSGADGYSATEHWTVKDGVLCIAAKGYATECQRVKADNRDVWFVDPGSGEVKSQYILTPQ